MKKRHDQVATARPDIHRPFVLVDGRNDSAHPNGNIFYSTERALHIKFNEILRVVAEIQAHSKPIIEHCYREFLLQSHDPDEREYPHAADQIGEILVHGNYLSQKDIEIDLNFKLANLDGEFPAQQACELHRALKDEYCSGDERGTH